MATCERCGSKMRGRPLYCVSRECREAQKSKQKGGRGRPPAEASRRARRAALQEERSQDGAGSRGPKPGEGSAGPGRPASEKSRKKKKEALQEQREEIGAGSRGPKPGEGSAGPGRPASEKSRKKKKKKEALHKEREEIGAGSRGPKPGEGSAGPGRPPIPEAERRGPPYVGEDDFNEEQIRRSYRHFLRGWAKFGLSRICQACGTLTPVKHCNEARGTGELRCRNCRENRTNYTLPTLPSIPASLQGLTNIERRLLAMARMDQVLIDKLPAGGPSAQYGRMYAVLMGEPAICNVFEGAELDEHGTIWVEGVQGMTASSARLGQLYAALKALKDGHFSYMHNPAVLEALETMQGVLDQLPTSAIQPIEAPAEGREGQQDDEGEDKDDMEVTYLP